MSNIEFAWPYCAILFLANGLIWFFQKQKAKETGYLFSPMVQILKNLPALPSRTKRNLQSFWPIMIWSLLTLALMRPQIVGTPVTIDRDARNLMLAVDISESMEAEDMILGGRKRDRLSVVKNVLTNFIASREGDRMGLVVFGSEAFLHAPLTFDLKTINRFLQEAQIGFAGPKTAIGDAIAQSVKKLIEQTKGDKVLILLTDGQNNTGAIAPLQALEIAKKHQVKIYVVGMGATSLEVDTFFGRSRINPSQDLEAFEPTLKLIASESGGKYFRGTSTNGLNEIYNELNELEPVKIKPIVLTPKKEIFYLLVILIFFLVAFKQLYLSLKKWPLGLKDGIVK